MAWLLLFVKDPSKAPAGTLTTNVTWKFNHDVLASGTKFTNKGTGIVNRSRVKTNTTPDVITLRPETDKHWPMIMINLLDNMVFIAGDQMLASVSMLVTEPQNLAEKLKKVWGNW